MKGLKTALLLVVLALWPASALARTSCGISAVTGVAFGIYDPLSGANADSTGSVTFTCVNSGIQGARNVGYQILLSSGGSGSYAPRRLTAGATPLLGYNLYTDASRTTIWGNGSGGSVPRSDTLFVRGTGLLGLAGSQRADRMLSIYGRIFGGQNVAAGIYSDSITVTVNF